jgi:hypothetical protein
MSALILFDDDTCHGACSCRNCGHRILAIPSLSREPASRWRPSQGVPRERWNLLGAQLGTRERLT